MSVSQEQPPRSVDADLREYLARRFVDIGIELRRSDLIQSEREVVRRESALIRGSTGFSGDTLTSYPEGWQPEANPAARFPPDITYDLLAGTITIGADGVYEVSGYAQQDGGSNNDVYAMTIHSSSPRDFAIGAGVWSNATGYIIHTASIVASLSAGEVISLIYLGANEPTISESDLMVKMLTPDVV